jgi:hypothetical protein
VDDRVGDVGCVAETDNSPQHDRAKYVSALVCYHVTLYAKIYLTQSVLGRVINLGDTTNITGTIIRATLLCKN